LLLRYVARRSLLALIILLSASILVFVATQLLPGNAALTILGKSATPARVHELDIQLHLNGSPVHQYLSWLGGLFVGHLGTSIASGVPVTQVIGGRLTNTAFLVVASGIIGIPAGLLLGILSAERRDGKLDNGLAVVTLGIAAIPEFVLALIFIVLFGTVVWHILPPSADLAPGQHPWQHISTIALPAITLAVAIIPYITRIMRAAMIDVLASEYVEYARIRGVSRWRLLFRHALPNAFAPAAQASAIALAYLAGGAVIVEYIYAYPGLGQGLVYAVQNRDVPVIQIITVMLAAFYVGLNLLADVITVLLSPRLRTGKI
jgi:peptide/nickel transport system permease protein